MREEANRLLQLKGYRLDGRCSVCDPSLTLGDEKGRKIEEWKGKLGIHIIKRPRGRIL